MPDTLSKSSLNVRVYFQYASGIKICKPDHSAMETTPQKCGTKAVAVSVVHVL